MPTSFLEAVTGKYVEPETLVTVSVGDCGVTEVGETAQFRAVLPNMRQVDLSGAVGLKGWGVPGGLAEAAERVSHLVLNDVDLGAGPLPPKNSMMNIKGLQLNNTNMSWQAIAEISHMGVGFPMLEELSLKGNRKTLESLKADPPAKLKRLQKLCLDGAGVHDWAEVAALVAGLPALTGLSLSGTALPACPAAAGTAFAGHAKLAKVDLEGLTAGAGFCAALGAGNVTDLRVGDGLCPREEIIAEIESLKTLNGEAVTVEERLAAEKGYITRAFREMPKDHHTHGADCAGVPETFLKAHPKYAQYVRQYGAPGGSAHADPAPAKTFLDAIHGKYVDCEEDVAAEADLVVSGEGQREEKKWVMVGMAKHKAKTGQLTRLRAAAVGEEGVAAVGDAAGIAAALPNLQQLELSQADGFEGYDVPAGIVAALPKLTHLDLSCVSLRGAAPPAASAFSKLQKLVLNKTGVAWADVAGMSRAGDGLKLLKELHIDANGVTDMTARASLPNLAYLSAMGNLLEDWDKVVPMFASAPELRELVLSNNRLPEPDASVTRALALSEIGSLSLVENPIASLQFTKLLAYVTHVKSLKLTYPKVAGVAPNHVRLMAIADMPHLTSLNTSTISAKERTEAEKLYILRAFATLPAGAAHKDDCSDVTEEFMLKFPRYKELVEKWGNPSTAQSSTTAAASNNGTANITFRDCIEGKRMKADTTRALPVFVKVGQLKAVVKSVFDVPPAEQVLLWKSLDQEIPIPTPLDNDMETLAYYGITGGSGLLEVSVKK